MNTKLSQIASATLPYNPATDTVIGVQGGTTDVQYPLSIVRTVLTGNLNLYVNASTGSDSYNGLSATYTGGVNGPYATIQGGLNNAAAAYDIAGFVLTLSCAAGTYDGFTFPSFISTQFQNNNFGFGVVIVVGDTSNVANVVIDGANTGTDITVLTPSPVLNSIDSLTLDGTNISSAVVLVAQTGASLCVGTPDTSATTSGIAVKNTGANRPTIFNALVLAALDLSGNITINGGTYTGAINSIQEAIVTLGSNNPLTLTVANGTQFPGPTGFASAGDEQAGLIQALAATFVDNGAIGPKFIVQGPLASIDVVEIGGNLNTFPGNAPGTCTAGGSYIYNDGSGNIIVFDGLPQINTQTASYQIALTDAGGVVEMNAAGANNLTIPANATTPFPITTRIDLTQLGAGTTTVVAAGGVTLLSAGGKVNIAGQYSGATLYQRAIDEWVLIGELA